MRTVETEHQVILATYAVGILLCFKAVLTNLLDTNQDCYIEANSTPGMASPYAAAAATSAFAAATTAIPFASVAAARIVIAAATMAASWLPLPLWLPRLR